MAGPVEEVLPTFDRAVDSAILDPPRRGCERRALEALLRISPPKNHLGIVRSPHVRSRFERAAGRGKYRLIEIQPIDMFP